jgi:mercuric ion binding protein
MKSIGIFVALAIFLSVNIAVAADNERTVTFEVQKMTCATCPITVRKAMQRVDGVKSVSVDFNSKTAIVTFDRNSTTATEIADASAHVGFPANAIDDDGL